MIFLFPRWDMLIPWRVICLIHIPHSHPVELWGFIRTKIQENFPSGMTKNDPAPFLQGGVGRPLAADDFLPLLIYCLILVDLEGCWKFLMCCICFCHGLFVVTFVIPLGEHWVFQAKHLESWMKTRSPWPTRCFREANPPRLHSNMEFVAAFRQGKDFLLFSWQDQHHYSVIVWLFFGEVKTDLNLESMGVQVVSCVLQELGGRYQETQTRRVFCRFLQGSS